MSAKSLARTMIERLAARYGYTLQISGFPPRGFRNFLTYVKERGFKPATVFDIGVGYGTPWLYDAFENAHFILIEPQSRFEPSLKAICERLDAEYHLVGVGAAERSMPLYQLPDSPTGSSFLPPTAQAEGLWGKFKQADESLPIVTLDRYSDRPGPFLVKIDTEGFELEVLQGASNVLAKTDLVLMEVAVVERQRGEADLVDIGSFMKGCGFRLFDIPVLTQRSADGPLLYMDVAFARNGGTVETGSTGEAASSSLERNR